MAQFLLLIFMKYDVIVELIILTQKLLLTKTQTCIF